MADAKYGRLFTEADMERLLRLQHDASLRAGRLEGEGDEIDDERYLHPLTIDEAEDVVPMTFPTDEPVFVLRGADRAALRGLLGYAAACCGAMLEIDPKHQRLTRTAYSEMRLWQQRNPDRVTLPD